MSVSPLRHPLRSPLQPAIRSPMELAPGASSGSSSPYVLNFATLAADTLFTRFGWSRTGTATLTNSGYLQSYGVHNLLLNSATLATQSVAAVVGQQYTLAIEGTGSVALSDGASGTLAGTGVSNRVSLTVVATTTNITFTVTGSATSAQFNLGPVALDYVPTTSAARYLMRAGDYTHGVAGLLLEGARTQQAIKSAEFENNTYWVNNACTAAALATPGPVVGSLERELTATAGEAYHYVYQNTPITPAAGPVSVTRYVKRVNHDWIFLTISDAAALNYFNLATGLFGAAAPDAVSAVAIADGYYKIVLTRTLNGSQAVNAGCGFASGNGGAFATTAGTEKIKLNDCQIELGYSTSHIPNPTTGTILRAADSADIGPGAEFDALFPPGGTGTIVLEWVDMGATDGDILTFHLNGATTELVSLYYDAGALKISCKAGNVSQLAATLGTPNALATNKASISWGAAGLSAVLNGGSVSANAGATIPAPTHVSFLSTLASGSAAAWKLVDTETRTTQVTGAAQQALTV